jgi:hypothetical protein
MTGQHGLFSDFLVKPFTKTKLWTDSDLSIPDWMPNYTLHKGRGISVLSVEFRVLNPLF